MARSTRGRRRILPHEPTRSISSNGVPKRYAGVWSLWALGVGAVISGHSRAGIFGFAAGGWGGLLVAGSSSRSCISA